MREILTEILDTVRAHSKKFEIIDSKQDEQSRMLRALLDAYETRKAQVDNHEVRLATVEGTIKGQAELALEKLSNR